MKEKKILTRDRKRVAVARKWVGGGRNRWLWLWTHVDGHIDVVVVDTRWCHPIVDVIQSI